MNNALPMIENLRKRKLRIDANCVFCGEHMESVNHLLFQCRFSKEVDSPKRYMT